MAESTDQPTVVVAPPNSRLLPPTWSDALFSILPPALTWVTDIFHNQRRQVIYMERQLQRRFKNEYRAQIREISPLLKERGRIIGQVVLDTIIGNSNSQGGKNITYAEAVSRSIADSPLEKLPLSEVLDTIDPLLTPILTPFVEGIKQPIKEQIGDIENKVKVALIITAALGAVAGFGTGFTLGSRRGGGGGGGGGGSDRGWG